MMLKWPFENCKNEEGSTPVGGTCLWLFGGSNMDYYSDRKEGDVMESNNFSTLMMCL